AVAGRELRQQGQGIMVVDETHGFAGAEAVHRAEDRGMAKTLRYATGVEDISGLGQLVGGSHLRSRLVGCARELDPMPVSRRWLKQRCIRCASNASAAVSSKQSRAYIFWA